jgi:hypothetical protein
VIKKQRAGLGRERGKTGCTYLRRRRRTPRGGSEQR